MSLRPPISSCTDPLCPFTTLFPSRADRRFDGLRRELVHQLDRARYDAGADDRGDRLRGAVHRRECRDDRSLVLRQWREAHGDLRHDAKRSEEHTSELQSLMRISYAVFCLKKKKISKPIVNET